MPQRVPRRIAAANSQAMRQHDGVDGAGAGRGDPLERDAIFFQKTIEHAPSKSAVAAATLKTQVNRLGLDLRRPSFRRIDFLIHEIASPGTHGSLTAFILNTEPPKRVPLRHQNVGTAATARRCRDAMQPELHEYSEKDILSQKEKSRIAEELAIAPGVFGALCITAILLVGLFILRGYGVLPATGHSLFAANAPLSPRAVVAQRFYFDSGAARQM
jgi:hypothetical protein